MKKLSTILILVITNYSFSQSVHQGNMMLDFYSGFPNFGKILITSNLSQYKTIELKGMAPSGFRGEYMIEDNIGLGFDFIYNYSDYRYSINDTTWLGDVMKINTSEVHSLMRRIRAHLRLNYHFENINPRLDTYFGVGFGLNNRIYTSTKNGIDNTDEFIKRMQLIPFPFSMRVCFGGRYYFFQYAGIVGEVGLGGPLVSFGLTFKY